MLIIYRVLINLIILISPLIIVYRLIKKKEDLKRFKEKFCFFSKSKKKGKLIWFHGASVGELLSIVPILEKLDKDNKVQQILVTSNTLSSSKIINKFKFKKIIHQFYPIDSNFLTNQFLNHWSPSSVFFIDSEIWPNMINNLNKNIALSLERTIKNKRKNAKGKSPFEKRLFVINNVINEKKDIFDLNLIIF